MIVRITIPYLMGLKICISLVSNYNGLYCNDLLLAIKLNKIYWSWNLKLPKGTMSEIVAEFIGVWRIYQKFHK